jgi:hypothetical protein
MKKRRRQFWGKKKQKQNEKKGKKHARKVKTKFSTSSILKKTFDKDNFDKKNVEKHCNKTKTMWRNILVIHNVFF